MFARISSFLHKPRHFCGQTAKRTVFGMAGEPTTGTLISATAFGSAFLASVVALASPLREVQAVETPAFCWQLPSTAWIGSVERTESHSDAQLPLLGSSVDNGDDLDGEMISLPVFWAEPPTKY